ncbi:hypothetical protein ABW21_db0206866 [Orbilia brochopaga]|nr:hypothetical protein ABW21_db0206866 [Drechslerella brochopaga]
MERASLVTIIPHMHHVCFSLCGHTYYGHVFRACPDNPARCVCPKIDGTDFVLSEMGPGRSGIVSCLRFKIRTIHGRCEDCRAKDERRLARLQAGGKSSSDSDSSSDYSSSDEGDAPSRRRSALVTAIYPAARHANAPVRPASPTPGARPGRPIPTGSSSKMKTVAKEPVSTRKPKPVSLVNQLCEANSRMLETIRQIKKPSAKRRRHLRLLRAKRSKTELATIAEAAPTYDPMDVDDGFPPPPPPPSPEIPMTPPMILWATRMAGDLD